MVYIICDAREFTYLDDRVSAVAGCEAAVTARTRSWLVNVYIYVFPLRLKGAVYESYVRPAMLYGSDSWCLKACEMGIL